MRQITNFGKFFLALLWCTVIRCIPGRFPNFEPIVPLLMPASRHFGWLGGWLFGCCSIILFDFITVSYGWWTVINAVTYGVIGMMMSLVLKEGVLSKSYYMGWAIVNVVVYDVITGLVSGFLCEQQPFIQVLLGQIPFTAMHLMGAIIGTHFMTQWIDGWMGDKNVIGEWGIMVDSRR